MDNDFKCHYLLNSAVLVEYGNDKILVDGLFSGKQQFDIMDESMENDIMEGKGIFSGIGYIVFTHCHNDHYNGSKIRKFIEKHPNTKVLLPPNTTIPLDFFQSLGTPLYILGQEEEKKVVLKFDNFNIEYIRCSHFTFKYPNHYCINITGKLGSAAFTGDMDMDRLDILEKFSKKSPAILFANHLALSVSERRNELHHLGYDKIGFYHVPSEEHDRYGYRKVAVRNWKRSKGEFPESQMFLEKEVFIPMN